MRNLRTFILGNLLATPGAPTVTPQGTTGATTYTYTIVAVNNLGQTTVAGTTGSTATGNATLTVSNKNHLTWTAVTNATSYNIYRTVGGGSTGLIGNTASLAFDDTGLVGDGTTSPVSNTTGFSTPLGVGDLGNKTVIIGAGTYTSQIQGSHDGSAWANIGSTVNAATCTDVNSTLEFIRIQITAYTSGTIAATLDGQARALT